MFFNRPEPGPHQRLENARRKMEMVGQAEGIDATHPRYPEFMEIRTEAQTGIEHALSLLQVPGSFAAIEQTIERLTELYEKACGIRAEMIGSLVIRELGDTQVLEQDIDRLEDTAMLAPVARQLKGILHGLMTNPSEVLDGQAEGNLFYSATRYGIQVNFSAISTARQQLNAIQQNHAMSTLPSVAGIVEQLKAGVERIASTDPGNNAYFMWNDARNQASRPNMKPWRMLGAVGGGLISAFGLGNVVFRGKPVTWPLALWLGITGLSVNPDLLRGAAASSLAGLNTIGGEGPQELMDLGFAGDGGIRAFDELQDVRRADGAKLDALIGRGQISEAELTEVLGTRNGALQSVLRMIPQARWGEALRTFGKAMSEDQQEMMRELMRARAQL